MFINGGRNMQHNRGKAENRVEQAIKLAGVITVSTVLIYNVAGCSSYKPGEGVADKSSKVTTQSGELSNRDESKQENLAVKNWAIQVKGVKKQNVNGLEMAYDFTLNAVKKGGSEASGAYVGVASLKESVDFSKATAQLTNVFKTSGMGGGTVTDSNVSITVSGSSDLASLVPEDKTTQTTVESSNKDGWDYAASGNFNMSGTAKVDLKADGIQGEKGHYSDSKQAAGAVPYTMEIVGNVVKVTIPKIGTFTGTLTSYVDKAKK
jgi:hypothetical protein